MPDAARWQVRLDDEYLAKHWALEIRDEVFRGAVADSAPVLVMIGAQPAAGKTRGSLAAAGILGEAKPVTRIVGDDYRRFHPDFKRVIAAEPLAMPEVTAQAAGAWTRMAIEHAFREKFSILVEGTWRNVAVPETTIGQAAEAGFGVHAVALAVSPMVSRLSSLERYYRDVDEGLQARWTPPAVHDEAAANFPETARAVGVMRHVDRVTVLDRSGAVRFDASAPDPATGEGGWAMRGDEFRAALVAAMNAPLTGEAAAGWERDFVRLKGLHEVHTATHLEAVAVWRQLDRDRVTIRGQVADADGRAAVRKALAAFDGPRRSGPATVLGRASGASQRRALGRERGHGRD